MMTLLRIALRNLVLQRERGALLFLVIAGASAVLVGVMALRTGVAEAQREAVTAFLSGDLNVGGFFKVHPDTIAPVIGDARPVRALVASRWYRPGARCASGDGAASPRARASTGRAPTW